MSGTRFHARLLERRSIAGLAREMRRIEVDRGGIPLMAPKGVSLAILVERVPTKAANIIKQEILARGGDLATPWSCADFAADEVDVIVIGNLVTLRSLIAKLYRQTVYHLPEFADALQGVLVRTVPGYLPVARQPARQGQVVEETLDDLHGGRIPLGPGGRARGVPELLPPARLPDLRWDFGRRVWGVAVLPAPGAGSEAGAGLEAVLAAAQAAVAAGVLVLELGAPPGAEGCLAALAALRQAWPDRLLAVPVRSPEEARQALAGGADILRAEAGLAPDLAPLVEAAGGHLWVGLPSPPGVPVPEGPQPQDTPRGRDEEDWAEGMAALSRQAWQVTVALFDAGLSPGRCILDPGPAPWLPPGPAARTLTRRLRELTSYGPPVAFSPWPGPVAAMAAASARALCGGAAFLRADARTWPELAPALPEIEGLLE
ncbi:MAG: hypothetical protein DIU70_000445 [Bacillota bacterium]